jgi:hypothetical protein
MTNALFISDNPNKNQELNILINDIKNQGVKTNMISPTSFHLDVLFDQQYGHPKVRKFKQLVDESNDIYVVLQAWNMSLLWGVDALFNFLSKEDLKDKSIIPVVILQGSHVLLKDIKIS